MYSNQLSLIFSSYRAEFSEGTDNWHIQWLLIFEAPVTLKRQNSKRPFLICNGCNLGSKTWIIQSGVQVKVLTMGCNEVAWSALSLEVVAPNQSVVFLGKSCSFPGTSLYPGGYEKYPLSNGVNIRSPHPSCFRPNKALWENSYTFVWVQETP